MCLYHLEILILFQKCKNKEHRGMFQSRGWPTFFYKVTFLVFANPGVSVTMAQLCHCSAKQSHII